MSKVSKFFYDTEFIEKKDNITLLEIAIVHSSGKSIELISSDVSLIQIEEAFYRNDNTEGGEPNYWLRDNVLKPLFYKLREKHMIKGSTLEFDPDNIFLIITEFGLTKEEMAVEIEKFIRTNTTSQEKIELYGYYSAYDHVAFCWIFGRMLDLPKGFPMYTIDLKQMLDETVEEYITVTAYSSGNHVVPSYNSALNYIKGLQGYPVNNEEHTAIGDAKWNLELYKFLKTLK